MGDTVRGKGQNVSTGEVAERLLEAPWVKEATVYGVKIGELEGRAGMAALVVGPKFDLAALAAHLDETLPAYARPLFLRLEPRIAMTGTFKHKKTQLIADGFDPGYCAGGLYFREPGGGYAPLTAEVYRRILEGGYRL